jgi:hypothetical protein
MRLASIRTSFGRKGNGGRQAHDRESAQLKTALLNGDVVLSVWPSGRRERGRLGRTWQTLSRKRR